MQCSVKVRWVSSVTPNNFASFRAAVLGWSTSLEDVYGACEYLALNVLLHDWPLTLSFCVVDAVDHLRQIYVEAIDYVSHHCTGCVDGDFIGEHRQLDVRRRCWKVGQIIVEERWRLNSSLYHSCFHLSAYTFFMLKMNFGSSDMHIVVVPATDCCRYVGVVNTIEQLLMVHNVECSCQIERDEHTAVSRLFC